MWDDDDKPKNAAQKLKNLDPMSVEDLKEYIEALREEITRAEAEITKKGASKAAAEAFFKS